MSPNSISEHQFFQIFLESIHRPPTIVSMLCMLIVLHTIVTDCVSMDGPFPHVQKCSVQNLPDQYKIASSAPGIVHYIQKYISQKTYSDFAKAITWPCHNSDLQTIVLCITLGVQKSQSCSHIPIFSSATSNCYHKMLEFFVLSLQKLIYYCNH